MTKCVDWKYRKNGKTQTSTLIKEYDDHVQVRVGKHGTMTLNKKNSYVSVYSPQQDNKKDILSRPENFI